MVYRQRSDHHCHLSGLAMRYKEMIAKAQSKGLASEEKMWRSIDDIDGVLCAVKAEHPEMFWAFMRRQHGVLYNGHYTEEFAEYDTKRLMWRDKDGTEHHGAHWSREQIAEATCDKKFPQGTTECDKWVAYNVIYSDLCRVLGEEKLCEVAYEFFFRDDDYDYSCGSKIWEYMS